VVIASLPLDQAHVSGGDSVGVNVFGANVLATSLHESSGYQVRANPYAQEPELVTRSVRASGSDSFAFVRAVGALGACSWAKARARASAGPVAHIYATRRSRRRRTTSGSAALRGRQCEPGSAVAEGASTSQRRALRLAVPEGSVAAIAVS
jgi:hypothetical protein